MSGTIRRLFIAIITLIVMGSCVTMEEYPMQIMHPAAYSVPPQYKSLMVIDNSFPFPDSVSVDVKGEGIINSNLVLDGSSYVNGGEKFDSLSSKAIEQLFIELNRRQFFDTVYNVPEKFNDNFGYDGKPINMDKLKSIADSLNVDAAVVLNACFFEPQLFFSRYYYANPIECTLSIRFVIEWLLFDTHTGERINRFVQIDTLYWGGNSDELIYPIPGMTSIPDAAVETAQYMGYYYSDHIAPYWEPVKRYFYKGGAGYYPEALKCVQDNDWVKAEKVWFFIYQHARKAEKARLAYNIAFAKEMQDDIEDAGRWAFHSMQLFSGLGHVFDSSAEQAKSYYLNLVKRYYDSKKLSQQYGSSVH